MVIEIGDTVYGGMREMARAEMEQGYFDNAQVLLDKMLVEMSEKFYPEHPYLTPLLDDKAFCCIMRNDWETAEQECRRSLQIKQKALIPQTCDVVETMRTLAVIEIELGKYDEAKKLLETGLKATDESTIGPVEEFHWQLGRLHGLRREADLAIQHFEQAVNTLLHRSGKLHRLAFCLRDYARFLRANGDEEKAKRLESEANSILSDRHLGVLPQDFPAPLYFADVLYPSTILH